jgi:putative ABC transport system permease protein
MFRNYITVAVRNILRHKAYAIINIAGLSVGMACTILILLWVQYELSFDRYHENADRIYRLGLKLQTSKIMDSIASNGVPAGPILEKKFPEVLKACRFRKEEGVAIAQYKEKKFFEEDVFYADNSVFDIFSFPMISGNPKSALKTAFSVVITEDVAKKYFGNEDPIGKIIIFNNEHNVTVTGVVKNIPKNSHFTFNMLLSFETMRGPWFEKAMDHWLLNIHNYTYLLLQKNCNIKELEKKFPALIDAYMGDTLRAIGGSVELFIQPLTSIHLHSDLKWEIAANGNIVYVYVFLAIALLILFIACINYINLSTARSANRAKEVGIRKLLGAHRENLVNQFLGESILFSLVSIIIALGLVELSLPAFESLFGSQSSSHYIPTPLVMWSCIGLMMLVSLIAGSYPALFLSAFQPIQVLTGRLKTGAAGSLLRNILVLFQFTISICMIIALAIIITQLKFMKHKQLGFNKEHIVIIRLTDGAMRRSIEKIKDGLKNYHGISHVAASNYIPGQGFWMKVIVPEGSELDQTESIGRIRIDSDFISTMDIMLVAGRDFSPRFSTEQSDFIIVNETAAKQWEWEDPIGKTIRVFDDRPITKTIIGVVRDFHVESLHKKIEPIYFEYMPESSRYINIKIRPDNIPETIQHIEKTFKQIDQTLPFDYTFLDESFDRKYKAEEKLNKIFTYFTLLAIFIACLGLFGLASFTAEQRTKEIGIRKALGASITGIMLLLSKEFTKWVLTANIIAWPIAYAAMNHWLQNFAYRIKIGLATFILAALLALIIALLTVGYQAVRAARANPVEALRYE